MKKIIFALTLAISLNAHAEVDYDFCDSFVSLATVAMATRQSGVDIEEAMKSYEGFTGMQARLLKAYAVPEYELVSEVEHAIREFAKEAWFVCLESEKGKRR